MCAIVGIGFQRNHTFFSQWTTHQIITKLLISGMSRGTTATGVCYTSNKEIVVTKTRLKATEFVKTDSYKNSLKKYAHFEGDPNKYIVSVIGHCRYKTKGSELNNDNNHPINCGNVIGVHNGMIVNDDAQFNNYKKSISRKAQVDSEIIFALINYFAKELNSIPKSIQKACNIINGGFACAMVHAHQPQILWLFRNNNPCTIYHFKEKGIIIFASASSFITEATIEHALGKYDKIKFDSHEGLGIDLYNGKYQRFDLGSL